MKRQLLSVCSLILLPLNAPAALRVFSCEPEWAALVTELAGDHAEVSTATRRKDPPTSGAAQPDCPDAARRPGGLHGAELKSAGSPC
jgi:zinc/manganese transport system substrate-binding protein